MGTGCNGTFVISWSQTEADGMRAPAPGLVTVGAGWRWTGRAVRVDTPGSALLLEGAEGVAAVRKRAARVVRRLMGAAPDPRRARAPDETPDGAPAETPDEAPEQGFVLTDGRRSYVATIIPAPDTGARLVMFTGRVPPVAADLWIVRASVDAARLAAAPEPGGVICFTPGARIATPRGARPVETLRPGDYIDTIDNGPQEILWTGHRRLTGARLYAQPHLRPIRFRAGAMGIGRPESELLVSPRHRMLVKGAAARALFGVPEVLAAAADLVDGRGVTVDSALREVTYIHILLERHQIVTANGLETESFHPANAAFGSIDPAQRDALLAILPGLAHDPHLYGDYARRNLSGPEAAILRREAA